MKKVRIISIYDNNNYGNRLQSFALQSFIKSLADNIDVKVLKNYSPLNERKNFFLRYIKYYKDRDNYSKNKSRKKSFMLFNENIDFSPRVFTSYSKADNGVYYIVGSDQVWNPHMGRLRDVDLLKSVESDKRIAYAASFGVSDIKTSNYEKVKCEIKKFKSISVREDSGKKIIEDLTGRKDIEVLLDPTMLISSSEWNKVLKRPKMLKSNKFILNYFLGNLSDDRKREIDKIARDNECDVINLLDKNSPFYQTGPSEFLYLEQNAFLICTDSFHSSVFAVLFDRPFIIFDREQEGMASMNSRIDTLINTFKLKNRRYNGKEITKDNLEHDYTEAYKILEQERKKSKDFLKKALDIDE